MWESMRFRSECCLPFTIATMFRILSVLVSNLGITAEMI